MGKEPEWEAYDPQSAWEWHDWAEARIEELEDELKSLHGSFNSATKVVAKYDQLQRKYDALAERTKMLLNEITAVRTSRYSSAKWTAVWLAINGSESAIRALLKEDDDE